MNHLTDFELQELASQADHHNSHLKICLNCQEKYNGYKSLLNDLSSHKELIKLDFNLADKVLLALQKQKTEYSRIAIRLLKVATFSILIFVVFIVIQFKVMDLLGNSIFNFEYGLFSVFVILLLLIPNLIEIIYLTESKVKNWSE